MKLVTNNSPDKVTWLEFFNQKRESTSSYLESGSKTVARFCAKTVTSSSDVLTAPIPEGAGERLVRPDASVIHEHLADIDSHFPRVQFELAPDS